MRASLALVHISAQALLDRGVDVVTMHLDSPIAVIQTVEAAGAYTIGFMSVEAPKYAVPPVVSPVELTCGVIPHRRSR